MGHRSLPNHREMLAVTRHMADVAVLKHEVNFQRELLINGLNAIVGTNQSFFYVAQGWRANLTPGFVSHTLTADRDPAFLRYLAEFGVTHPLRADPFCDLSFRNPSSLQSMSLKQVLPTRGARKDYREFVDVIQAGRVSDGVVCFYREPGATNRVIGVGMHQFGAAGMLGPKQRELVRFAVIEIRELANRGHLPLPGVEAPLLAPRPQQVLDQLLDGRSPKKIAYTMGLSVYTVREYIQVIYRKFNVNGRDELTAKLHR